MIESICYVVRNILRLSDDLFMKEKSQLPVIRAQLLKTEALVSDPNFVVLFNEICCRYLKKFILLPFY